MKILFVSAEVAPFAKVGGLADVAGSLPNALERLGHDVRVLMPAYKMVLRDRAWKAEVLKPSFTVQLNPFETFKAKLHQIEHHDSKIWLIGAERFFDGCTSSETLYSPGRDAYLFFSAAAMRACEEMDWIPDIVHANDWHTGFVPVLMREKAGADWDRTASLFTIHNLAYQGEFGQDTLDKVALPFELYNMHQLETFGSVNFLKAGAVFSDHVNTVSPTYSCEIQSPEFGCRLEGLMSWLSHDGRLSGILNGIDTEDYNPGLDSNLEARYSADSLEGKTLCQKSLLKALKMAPIKGAPVIGVVSRLSSQKGMDLILEIAPKIFELPAQLIIQGLGDPWLAEQFRLLAKQYPKHFRFIEKFEEASARRVYAGSDMFLMPSSFEPCGLGQMIAMRYGTVPIVRKTGGLADTIFEGQNGFVFEQRSSNELLACIERAHQSFSKPKTWQKVLLAGMRSDLSWSKSAKQYENLYEELVRLRIAALRNGHAAQVLEIPARVAS